jgi:hypothetical protein
LEIWRCREALKRSGLSLIVIDKNIGPPLRLADRHFIIEKERVVWSGTSEHLRAQPEKLHEYVGVYSPDPPAQHVSRQYFASRTGGRPIACVRFSSAKSAGVPKDPTLIS